MLGRRTSWYRPAVFGREPTLALLALAIAGCANCPPPAAVEPCPEQPRSRVEDDDKRKSIAKEKAELLARVQALSGPAMPDEILRCSNDDEDDDDDGGGGDCTIGFVGERTRIAIETLRHHEQFHYEFRTDAPLTLKQ